MLNKSRIPLITLILSCALSSMALERISLLPPDQQVRVRISNTTEFLNRLEKSPLGQLWADPQFQDFAGNPSEKDWMDLFFQDKSEAYKEITRNQLAMLKGELAFGGNSDSEGVFIIAAMSPKDYLRSLEQDELLKTLGEAPFEIIHDEFQGIKLARHIRNGGTEEEQSSWQAHLANTLLIGNSKEWVERSIIQLKNESPDEPEGSPTLNLQLKLSQLIEEMIQSMEGKSPSASGALGNKAIFEALGLLGVENCSVSIRLDKDKMVSDSTLNTSNLSKGLFAILDTQASSLPTVTFIPESASSIEVGRINLLGLWRELPNIFSAISPSGQMQFAMISGMIQQQAQIDLDQDLLSNLDTQYLSFSVTEPETARQVKMIGIELKNSDAFKSALETGLNAPALQPQIAAALEKETFLEHTVYTIKNQQEGGTPLAFAIAANRLFYGPPSVIRQVIRTQSSSDAAHTSFENSPLVRGLRQHIPSNAFGYSAINWKKQMESVLKELSNPAYMAAFQLGLESSGTQKDLPDFGKLPPAEHLASFFNTTYQYTEKTDSGLHQRIITQY